jgi:hypothetical protein
MWLDTQTGNSGKQYAGFGSNCRRATPFMYVPFPDSEMICPVTSRCLTTARGDGHESELFAEPSPKCVTLSHMNTHTC